MSTAIHWFRRDLRLTDNTALSAALTAYDHVVPVYIVSDWKQEHRWTGPPRQEFLCGCLAELEKGLRAKGGRLIIRSGSADAVLAHLAAECGAEAIYFNRDPDPFGCAMEQKIRQWAAGAGVAISAWKDVALHERDEVLTGGGTPFRVFTPYSKAWRKLEKSAPGGSIKKISTPPKLASDPLPTLAHWELTSACAIIAPGETAARQRLNAFLASAAWRYGDCRNFPAGQGTSRLSQDLRHGTLSAREVYAQCLAAARDGTADLRRNLEVFINELIWREFYFQVLWHWPDVLEHEFQSDYRGLQWQGEGEAFARWCAGQTGFPIVDAGMREMCATGFMHNRVRMITAMFLTKDLHLDWRLGESYFMQRLVDGEIAANNGGWQWSASTGTDAAPYFRIQNPWSQAKRFDPDGDYTRRWIPELRDVPNAKLTSPPEGVPLARGYPLPMVDHHRERDVALEMYRR